MNIILIGSPEGQASFVASAQGKLPCKQENECIEFQLTVSEEPMRIVTMGLEDAGKVENTHQITKADAVIYAGIEAMRKNRLECEYLLGFNAANLLKNLHQLLLDHHRPSHSFR